MPSSNDFFTGARLYGRAAWNAFFPAVPPYLIYFVTHRCNARCSFCFNRDNQEKASVQDELSVAEVEKIASSYRGTIHVTLTGGEPFLRDDLYGMAAAFVKAGAASLTIASNGILTEKIVSTSRKILADFPDVFFDLDLSVDGPEKVHDETRGVPGAHQKVMATARAVSALQKENPRFRAGASLTVTAFNQDTAEETVNELSESGLFRRVQVLWVRGAPFDPRAADADFSVYEACRRYLDGVKLAPRESKAKEALSRRARETVSRTVRDKTMILPCQAGRTMVTMDPYGDLYPCEMLWQVLPDGDPQKGIDDWRMGALRSENYDMKKTVKNDKSRAVRRWIKEQKCFCSFECAAYNNIVFNPRTWPSVLRHLK